MPPRRRRRRQAPPRRRVSIMPASRRLLRRPVRSLRLPPTTPPVPKTTLICDCNRTMAIDGPALAKVLGTEVEGAATVHSLLCRREAPAFQRAARAADDLLVACTQESRLFVELAEATEGAPASSERPIRFVNIRETGGWSKDRTSALPKMAALIAAAQLPPPEPVPSVSYASAGRVLVIGDAQRATRAAALLGDGIEVSLLVTDP